MKRFNTIICGGTFDHLHQGHKLFLRFGLSLGKKLIIGITSDSYVVRRKAEGIERYSLRRKRLETFLRQEKAQKNTTIIPIDDVFGPTTSEEFLGSAILVTPATKKGALLINRERKKRGFTPLKILVFREVITAKDGTALSSTRIRNGEVDSEGNVYRNTGWFTNTLFLDEKLRSTLKRPLGKLISEKELRKVTRVVATVGDITTKTANSHGVWQKISLIDFVVQRKKTFSEIRELGFSGGEKIIRANNPAGTLTPQLFSTISYACNRYKGKKRIIIQVSGEEDLTVLPLVLFLPLGAVILYGQPGVGMVRVVVDERTKRTAYKLVMTFKTRGY